MTFLASLFCFTMKSSGTFSGDLSSAQSDPRSDTVAGTGVRVSWGMCPGHLASEEGATGVSPRTLVEGPVQHWRS